MAHARTQVKLAGLLMASTTYTASLTLLRLRLHFKVLLPLWRRFHLQANWGKDYHQVPRLKKEISAVNL